MRVVIAEQMHHGHYYTYTRRVLEAARELTHDITLLVTPEGLKSKEFAANLADSVGKVDVRNTLTLPRGGMVEASLGKVSLVRRAVKECRPDVLYIPAGDHTAEAVGMARMVGWSVLPKRVHSETLMTRLTFAYPGANRTVPAGLVLQGLRRSPWDRIHLIDLLAYEWLRRNEPSLAERFTVIPDPVETFAVVDRARARRRMGLPEEGRYLVCPGILIGRKGIDLLIEAFRLAASRPTDRILLAGPVGDDVGALLQQPEYKRLIADDRVLVVDKYLNSEELGLALCAADVVCCPYPHQWHPSSIAVKAMACHRPVLGADSFWLGKMVPMFGMGWTVPVHDRAAFALALPKVLDEASTWQRTEAAARLVAFQSVEQFKACWMEGLRSKLGLPRLQGQHDWAWVSGALDTQSRTPDAGVLP